MKRTLVISDIHGEIELFERLLTDVNYDSSHDQLILLGDYVDRGANSRKVLEKVIELKSKGALVLKGNHEDMMIKALTTDEERYWKNWINRNGGRTTLESYGFTESEFVVPEDEEFNKPKLHSETLDWHLEFIQNLDHFIELEEYIFVHAGVHPNQPIKETAPYTLMWIREEFYSAYSGQKTIVFGHTPTKHLHGTHSIFFGKNRIIGIDGGAVFGGQLNCLELPSLEVYSVKSDK
ncbi:serine/threonine protein phosphatase [Sporosarcina sp. Marseille-Q4063]|uniref:metallophosphoesterase family protein n=1 Tax=Sporosarcina sp. Marseille-Q4063 TaxID=2810514 RepID=UPI001BAE8645|nr:metallophosphoesterase family protein [Sporosarcina sp. Marseille-Q4063]QUW22792.1 serine/threonine protein phosphatase [Sporosarcina sp. Marseille-Q4063]